jgi:3-oxoadipate enol-lactonase
MSEMDTALTVNGQALRIRVEGPQGAPWLVFSNSLMTDLSLWDGQVAAFGALHRILRYDTRGHGGSAVPDGDCDFTGLVADLAGLMRQVDASDATVCGVSMGGVTALGLAARYPDLVARVAVCDCQPASTPAGTAAWEERIAVARAGGMAALVEPTASRWLRPGTVAANGPAVAAVRRMVGATKLDGFIRAARALQSYDFTPELAALAARRCPAAFIVGAEDAALPQVMRSMAASCPGASLTIVPECGHLPNLEQPRAFHAALRSLLTTPTRS